MSEDKKSLNPPVSPVSETNGFKVALPPELNQEPSPPVTTSAAFYRFQQLTVSTPPSPKASDGYAPTPTGSYRFGRTVTSVSPPQVSSMAGVVIPPASPPKTMKYRFALPSRQTALRATDFSNDSQQAIQQRSLPKGLLILSLLASPFILLLLLSSLALIYQPSQVVDSTINRPAQVTNGTQFDYSPIYERARELVRRDELSLALQLLSNIPQSSVQRDQIAAELVTRAQSSYPANLKMAVYIASNVPPDTKPYVEAQQLLKNWNPQFAAIQSAEYAISQQQWDEANSQLQKLFGTPVQETNRFQQLLAQVQRKGVSSLP